MQILEQDERDSEDPDEEDSQIMEDRYREFDPQLDQRIAAIKKQIGSQSNSNAHEASDTQTQPATSSYTGATQAREAQLSNNESSSKQLSKLEEVLKRQRERLENISGSFAQNPGSSDVPRYGSD